MEQLSGEGCSNERPMTLNGVRGRFRLCERRLSTSKNRFCFQRNQGFAGLFEYGYCRFTRYWLGRKFAHASEIPFVGAGRDNGLIKLKVHLAIVSVFQ